MAQARPAKRKRCDDGSADDACFLSDACDVDDEEMVDFKPVNNPSIDPETDAEDEDSDDSDSDSDADEDEDDEGLAGKCEYFENSEQAPKCVAYDKDFAQVGEDLTHIAIDAIKIIDSNGCASSRVQNCRTTADALLRIPAAKREKVALLGNTGAGKSSLLNSLLGLPNLAKAMASGSSCTFVGTEYESRFAGQSKPFAAKVEYFDINAVRELLGRLLKDYSTWTFEKEDDWDEDEMQELKRLCITAFNTFRCLFCDKPEFDSPGAAIEYLERSYNDPDDDTHATLVGWCAQLLAEKEADEADHIEYLDADTQPELLDQLSPLVFSTNLDEKPALWPLVKKVRVGLDGVRILDHITIVDLPGLDDTNQVRVNASLDMMRSCDTIWVVTKIDRAITDSGVDSLLMRYGRAFKIVVICTGIDDNLDPALAAQLQSEGQSIGEYNEWLSRENELRKLIKRVPKKIETRKAKLEGRAKSRAKKKQKPLTEAAREKLQVQIESLTKELLDAETELPKVASERYNILVDTRNANTIRRLKNEKSDHLPAGQILKVFTVSNLHYAAWKGARHINGPRLDVAGTGLPALRTFIMESAAPLKLQAMEDFISHRYTVFMKGIAMWAKSYSVEGSDVLLKTIRHPEDRVQKLLDAYREGLLAANNATNVERLRQDHEKLVTAALEELKKKQKWNWGTIRAFIRRDGNHKTSVAPKQSWNEQFQVEASNIFQETWPDFTGKQQALSEDLKRELLSLVESIRKTVQAHPAALVLPMDRFQEILDAQLEGIEQACRDFQELLDKELRNIHLDLTQDRHTGYFAQAMSEAYVQCKSDAGTGIKRRNISTFEIHLNLTGDRSPFSVMLKKLSKALVKETKLQSKKLDRKVDGILSEIYRQFDDMVDEKIDDRDEEDVREQFRAFLPGAEARFEDIKADLARIKRRYAD